jgi:hypothetical protein
MFWVPEWEYHTLPSLRSTPDLNSTDEFWSVVQTLPEGCTIPVPIIKLGLISNQLTPVDSDINVGFSDDDILSDNRAVVPPETLTAIRHLLANIVDKLNEQQKEVIGEYCEVTELNRPSEQGDSIEMVKDTAPPRDQDWPDETFFQKGQDESGKESGDSPTNDHSSDKNHTFDSGKRVTKKGGERITGKNPFADSDKLKDTGLHQGGG